jgi:hypothetical protein
MDLLLTTHSETQQLGISRTSVYLSVFGARISVGILYVLSISFLDDLVMERAGEAV